MVDAHVHLWDQTRFHYPWLTSEPDPPETVLPSDLGDAHPAAREFVFVQADCRSGEGLAEARWVDSLSIEATEIRGVVAFAPLEERNAVAPHLEALADVRSVVGVRRLLQDETSDFIKSDELMRGIQLLEAHGWTFDACIRWQQLEALIDLAKRTPEVTIILDHLGKPPLTHPQFFDHWRAGIAKLAALPNTVIKMSGLPAEAPPEAGLASFRPWLHTAVELFGADRSMVGTDWPVSARPDLTRGAWFDVVRDSLRPGVDEWCQISDGTAVSVYGLT